MSELSKYAEKIPRIQQLKKQGWRVFDVDMIDRTIGLEKYVRVITTSRGKRKIKERRKVKRVKMRKREFEWLRIVSEALTFGFKPPTYKEE